MSKKDIVYVDSEDDITKIISRVKSSNEQLVALVLPKNSIIFQSSVNMKLLKSSADKIKKKVVLITKEKSLYPIAGASGVFVAETLKSHPYIPKVDDQYDADESVIEDDPSLNAAVPVGVLAADKIIDSSQGMAEEAPKKEEKKKSKSKVAVPNFGRFRTRTFLMILAAIALIIGWFVAFKVLPTADITIYAQTSKLPTEVEFTADSSLEDDDLEKNILAAEVQTLKKTQTETFEPTGKKDVGKKSTGTMTVENCDSDATLSLPSGTIFTDPSSGFGFSTDAVVDVPGGSFGGGGCTAAGTADIAVTAISSGDEQNLSARSYTSNYSSYVTGAGSDMSGGTSEIVKVVSQADVNKAKKSLESKPTDNEKAEVAALFGETKFALVETFDTKSGDATSKPAVGEEADSAEITMQFTYTMMGVSLESLTKIVEDQQKTQITEGEQVILDNGISTATVTVTKKVSNSKSEMLLNTDGFAGPEINTEALANEISGKRFSEVVSIIESKAGVQSVDVKFSPFYVFSAPKASKITINVEISDSTLQ